MDLSPISEICRKIDDIIEMIKATVKVKPVPMDSTSSIKHHIVEANRAAQDVLDAVEEISSNKPVFSVPSDRDPAKIAIWISGIFLAVAITTIKVVIQNSQ